MSDFNVIGRIDELCKIRGWSRYKLSQQSGVSMSTIANLYKRTDMPTIPTLMSLCDAFGISLAQFFAPNEYLTLSEEQKNVLKLWDSLNIEGKTLAMTYLKGLAQK